MAIAFTTPLLLWGLLLLPLLWWLLRAVPPAPVRRRFPGVALLLGLSDARPEADRTPWWLLALRLAALAALIIGFAGPVLNPPLRAPGQGPLLLLLDGSWADARDWARRLEKAEDVLAAAAREGRPAALVQLTAPPPGPLMFQPAAEQASRLSGLIPAAFEPGADAQAWAAAQSGRFETYWLSDGLDRPSRAPVLAALEARGPVQVWQSGSPVYALSSPVFSDGKIRLDLRSPLPAGAAAEPLQILAIGPDPSGVIRELARLPVSPQPGSRSSVAEFDLPAELRNRIARFEVEGQRSAATLALADDTLRRRKVALVALREDREGLQLLSPLHYLREALRPGAELSEGALSELLQSSPDVIVLADVAVLTPDEEDGLLAFLNKGGLLLRFAGPQLAVAAAALDPEDPLMPVRLREGGRMVGGAMSWGEPRGLAPFAPESPFYGLEIPEEVSVTAQVLAQPDPDLSTGTIAALADGTPLVTRAARGEGQVVLFHVTANADWSGLPLSGLFVEMLERLTISARSREAAGAAAFEGRSFSVMRVADGFGRLSDGSAFAAVPGAALAAALPGGDTSARLPPGLYQSGAEQVALNVTGPARHPEPAVWPDHIRVEGAEAAPPQPLKGALLSFALLALLGDILATLSLSGRLGRGAVSAALALALLWPMASGEALAQTSEADRRAIAATSEVVLAFVRSGDSETDRRSEAGLRGLGLVLRSRTTIEPGEPVGVDPETDELAFFPFLYWPITPEQPMPSPAAYRKLNQYLRSGGMILFDTRDADIAGYGGATPEGRRLQMIARPLQIPPLEPVPEDHVLTRTFYLLQDFPGRHAGRPVWVEAAPPDAELAEGMPFRNLNDGVTPVVIGGNDWAGAWAADARGLPLYPIGRGFSGERQREMAWRFGVNLIMHVLTGNYKSDQVHVPALLERLGE